MLTIIKSPAEVAKATEVHRIATEAFDLIRGVVFWHPSIKRIPTRSGFGTHAFWAHHALQGNHPDDWVRCAGEVRSAIRARRAAARQESASWWQIQEVEEEKINSLCGAAHAAWQAFEAARLARIEAEDTPSVPELIPPAMEDAISEDDIPALPTLLSVRSHRLSPLAGR